MTSATPPNIVVRTTGLWLLVFAGGWFVMLTELVGARVLSPYFGNTIYVWGSVIGIFLLAMAAGYALGGRLTARYFSPWAPAVFAALAGLYVACTPFYQDRLCAWLYTTGIQVKWGALIGAAVLYAAPMVLLGILSPYSVQIATRTHMEAGNRAGALYALSTTGSFIGCLVTAFVLIPGSALSHVAIFSGMALTLIAIASGFALSGRPLPAAVAIMLVVAGLVYSAAADPGRQWKGEMKAYEYTLSNRIASKLPPDELNKALAEAQAQASAEARGFMPDKHETLFEVETPYHHMVVLQEGPLRQLVFGNPDFHPAQSAVDLRKLSWHVGEYTHMSFAGMLYRKAPERVCVIGIGGGTIPRSLELCFPGVKIDAVDIDPTVADVAQKYFYWRPSSNVRIYAQDGRSFINWCLMNRRPKYDWIMVDAYDQDYVPFHLTTTEFLEAVKRMLNPDGVVAMNMFLSNDLYGCEARTFERVFGGVNTFAGHRSGNVIFVSQNGRTKPLTIQEAGDAARRTHIPANSQVSPAYILSCMCSQRNWRASGPVLTDLWAPVESLIAQ